MANLPSFNPNTVNGANRDAHRNRAVTDLMEPGSTMKPLTVAAALEAGVITPHTQVRHQSGHGFRTAATARPTTHNYGVLDTTGVITKSSNVGAAQIVRSAARPALLRLRARASATAAARTAASPAKRRACCRRPRAGAARPSRRCPTATACNVTPLQIARAYAALGNGGRADDADVRQGPAQRAPAGRQPRARARNACA